MAKNHPILGKYKFVKNENLNEYFEDIGVPFIPRKLMTSTSPSLEIILKGDVWTITTITLLRTIRNEFKIGEQFEEVMDADNVLQSVASLEDNKLVINTIHKTKRQKSTRKYELTNDGLVIDYIHDKSTRTGKRYFARV